MKIERYLESSPIFAVLGSAQAVGKKLNGHLGELELNFLQAMILVALFFEENRTSQPARLHQAFGTTKGNISHCLAYLEERHWVKRISGGGDRRVSRVALTASGEAICSKLIGYFDRIQDEFETVFPKSDARQLFEGLARVSALKNL